MTDGDGVLENLPRSRPGHRSAKRAAKPGEPAKVAKKAKPRATPKARATPKPRATPKVAKAPAEKPRPASTGTPNAGDSDGGSVLDTVSSAAGSVARVAQGITREVLRRVPRP